MYGKVFASMFTGSMRGKGDLQLTFAYMLANATSDGICDFMPQCIADATGKPLALIQACLAELESPDEMSRTKADGGRRIRLLDPERSWGWQIVNYRMYRDIATRDAMKEAERLRKRDYRAAKETECPGQVPDKAGHSPSASPCSSPSEEKGMQGEGSRKRKPVADVVLAFDSAAFAAAWADWQTHRREIKKPLTGKSMEMQMAEFKRWGEDRAIKAIRHTIAKGWQGIREEETRTGATPKPQDWRSQPSEPIPPQFQRSLS